MRIISGKARGTKLYTLEGMNTRPTLDRVKESLFNILQNDLQCATVLDLFSGSGALGIEALSRGSKKAILCDNNYKAIELIKKNIEKCKVKDKIQLVYKDYKKCLNELNEKIDIIFIDPPYKKNIAVHAVKIIVDKKILNKNGIIILETDDEQREIKQLKNINNIMIQDLRKYGRVKLIFLKLKQE